MEPKYCRVCKLLLTLENAAVKFDVNGNSKMTDKCKICLIKIFERLRQKRKNQQKSNIFVELKKKIRLLFVKVGERLGRMET